MKGIVVILLEEVVGKHYGDGVWNDLLDAVDLTGAYTSLGSYPDSDMSKLVGAAASALSLPPAIDHPHCMAHDDRHCVIRMTAA